MANENTQRKPEEPVELVGVLVARPATFTTPTLPELTGRQKLWLAGLVIMKRVRFLAILAGVGLFICNWETVKSRWDRWTHPRAAAARELPPGQEFYCSMDPQVVRTTYEPNGDVPGCPICGMPLTIRAKGQQQELPPGVTGRVQLSPQRIQMAGIQTVAVGYRPMARQTKTVGYVTYDESRLSRVVSRVGGYVEKLFVDKTFTLVHKGDRLAEIYSPELYSAAKELIQAERFGVSREVADREKLLLLGVSEQEVREIANSKEPPTRLVIRAPQSGFVMEKKIVAGASIEARMTLFELADLSTVWVEAEVYEKDIAFLQPGQRVEAAVEAYPNRTFAGELASIYPRVEAATRTNRIRVRLENPDNALRPGMYAAVTIETPLGTIEPYKTAGGPEFLVVPEEAVVDTGEKKIVYVERKEELFEGVEVELGPRQDDFYPVLKGLAAGDKVAAAGGFLVDAETRLNPAAASTYFGASGGPTMADSPPRQVHVAGGKEGDNRLKPELQTGNRLKPGLQQPGLQQRVSLSEDELKNIQQLPEEDRQPARIQALCPVTNFHLGSMGVPVKITLRGQPVYLCCKGCIGKAKRDPDGMLKKLAERNGKS